MGEFMFTKEEEKEIGLIMSLCKKDVTLRKIRR